MTTARRHALSLHQAAEESPTLARLVQLTRESSRRLELVRSLIPLPLRTAVRPGPIEGAEWCLLVDNNAAAAKLRQVLPALQAELNRRGCEVNSIRLRVGRPLA